MTMRKGTVMLSEAKHLISKQILWSLLLPQNDGKSKRILRCAQNAGMRVGIGGFARKRPEGP